MSRSRRACPVTRGSDSRDDVRAALAYSSGFSGCSRHAGTGLGCMACIDTVFGRDETLAETRPVPRP